MPNRRPWTTWRLYVFRYVSKKNSRSSGVGRGQFLYTLNWRAVRGCPSRRHAAICAWNAASKGGTSCRSEEHTSELQSRPHLVCRLLLGKKKKTERCTSIRVDAL